MHALGHVADYAQGHGADVAAQGAEHDVHGKFAAVLAQTRQLQSLATHGARVGGLTVVLTVTDVLSSAVLGNQGFDHLLIKLA